MTYSLDEAVAWAKLPITVEYRPDPEDFYVIKYGTRWSVLTSAKNIRHYYLSARNQLAAYLPPESKPGKNVDVVA